jgi:hypothetical protein
MFQGLSNGVFWMSWALTYLVMLLISSVLIMFVLSKSVFGVIAPGIIFIVFFLFSLSSIALAILVSAFFSRAKTAGVISLFLLIAIFFPYFAVSGSTYTLTQKQAGSLSSPIAFSLGLQQILKYQDAFTPVNKDNVGEVLGNYSIANSIGFLILDTFLYVLLAWYCDNVVPQEFGTQLPWYFPFTKSYWKNVFNIVDQIADDEELLSADLIDVRRLIAVCILFQVFSDLISLCCSSVTFWRTPSR